MPSRVLFGDQFVLLVDNPPRLDNMPKGLIEFSLHAAYVRIVGRVKMRLTGLVSQGDVCPRRLEITLQAETISAYRASKSTKRGSFRVQGWPAPTGYWEKASEFRRRQPAETVPGTQAPKN